MSKNTFTFHEAIDMGEYNPEFLSQYDEWKGLSKHAQLQFIRKGLENRRHQLLSQWADVSTALDLRLKPELKETLKNIELQLSKIEEDKEKLYLEYSK